VVWKATAAGPRACCRRAGACAQGWGRDTRTATGHVTWGSVSQQLTASWQVPTWPRVPEDGRATPTAAVPCLGTPVASQTTTPSLVVASAISVVTRCRVRSASSHGLLVRTACHRCALVPGTAWAMESPCVLGRSVRSPVV
jgi:hypothetical protein